MMCLGVVGSTLDFCQDDFMHCVLMFGFLSWWISYFDKGRLIKCSIYI